MDVRRAGYELSLFNSPMIELDLLGTYIPRKEIAIEEQITATVIAPGQAIRLCAKKDMIDRLGERRVTGEQWLIKQAGAYLPLAYETVVKVEKAQILTDKKALHLRALKTFKDDFGQMRNYGDEWLVTRDQTEAHILHVYEELVGVKEITVLSSREYCVILNPMIGKCVSSSLLDTSTNRFSFGIRWKDSIGPQESHCWRENLFPSTKRTIREWNSKYLCSR